jgi:two-component system, NtrC family, response regulator PilR
VAQVLIVDDEQSIRELLQILLEGEGHDVATALDVPSALEHCRRAPPDLVFSDLKLGDGSGMEVLRFLREQSPETQVIMMTAFATAENAIQALRLGAYDYQIKPVKMDEIRLLTQKALEKLELIRDNRRLAAELGGRFGLSRFVGKSPRLMEVMTLIEKVAPTLTNVLVEGESGTGKELVARAVHDGSRRAAGPFVAVNCGAIPETLIEAELFGHAAGAFTGANKARRGLFEAANGGTLLLDEIGELPPAMQVKLLRVIQERAVRPVGSEAERPVDVRLVAATNRDLAELAREKMFREDLFYRLNVVRIRVPPLRERREDVPLLARAFVARYARDAGKSIDGIDDAALRLLGSYAFPGNVRELENYMERAVALATGPRIGVSDLPEEVRNATGSAGGDLLAFPDGGVQLERTLDDIERRFIGLALERSNGVKSRAAELLGLTFRSLRYRLKKLGLADADVEEPAESE